MMKKPLFWFRVFFTSLNNLIQCVVPEMFTLAQQKKLDQNNVV